MAPNLRGLCRQAYPGHPKGCPNFSRREGCPPAAALLGELIDLQQEVLAAYVAVDLAGHVAAMQTRHPHWSDAQLYCCLYWQGSAKAALKRLVEHHLSCHEGLKAVYCPEGSGVNVTTTLAQAGIHLEWPPRSVAYKVALLGRPA
jgi:predicted metal-binding protein